MQSLQFIVGVDTQAYPVVNVSFGGGRMHVFVDRRYIEHLTSHLKHRHLHHGVSADVAQERTRACL